MITVRLRRASSGQIVGFSVRGHSGSAAKGRDIVCAAVSALTQGAALGLQRRLGIDVALLLGDGEMDCALPTGSDPAVLARAQDILETMRIGLEEIAADHPRLVTIRQVEASGVVTV